LLLLLRKTPPVKGGIPEGTKIYAAETTEIEVPSEQKKKAEKATSMDLVLILDKSGSMYGLEKDTIGGFNSMLDKQRESNLPVKVTAVMFNNAVSTIYERTDLNKVKNITEKEYTPQGTTALLDAVGNTPVPAEDPARTSMPKATKCWWSSPRTARKTPPKNGPTLK
jgi:hypothetical protein